MQRRLVPMLATLALIAACADSPTGPNDGALAIASAASNPPPPSFGGTLVGDFDVSGTFGKRSLGATAQGLSLEVGSGGYHHRFTISPVEYNANTAQTAYWMNFPSRPLGKGRIYYSNGQTTGSGLIADFDQANNGWWVIDLAQFTGAYNVFGPCTNTANWVNCVELTKPIVATFVRTVGTDENGKEINEKLTSDPALLRFATDF